MDDLEIVKACAAAMGYRVFEGQDADHRLRCHDENHNNLWWWPLTDDEQAMALIHLLISKNRNVHIWSHAFSTFDGCRSDGTTSDMKDPAQLRRAICLCVAALPATEAGR